MRFRNRCKGLQLNIKEKHVFTGIEGDCLGNSVSMNLPVKPIDSWSSGIRHWSSSGGTDIRISSRNTFTRTPSLVVFWWNRPSNLFTQHFHSKWKAVVFWWH
ncbi:unnamed protein product [Protopolystoma xenopodis]|uniref:Uncharacterized protein n=1 Tax=Protopolystoma xenopodis TaxID=117903 RepID=A0A448WYQ3_9PLAT|nr:unnamed protein product [Protopolystoma xenopodis]